LIDKYGKTTAIKPTFKNGVATDGRFLTMQLVMEGMALYVLTRKKRLPAAAPPIFGSEK
jgi:hypothetical protein